MRKWMVDMRNAQNKDLEQMAIECDCSRQMLYIIECGSITHPQIAAAVARAYGMTTEQYNTLVSERHRAAVIPVFKEPRKPRNWYSGGLYEC